MMLVRNILCVVLVVCGPWVFAQMQYIENDDNILHFVQRYQHLYQLDSLQHTSIRKIRRNDVKRILKFDKALLGNTDSSILTHINNALYFAADNSVEEQRGLWNSFYKNKAHFFEVKQKDFELTINPILNLQFGKDFDEPAQNIFNNTRGLEIWGELDKKLYFYSSILETQSNFLNYINPFIEKYNSIPGQGNYKLFNSRLFSIDNAYDYGNAQAYLGFKMTKHSHLELGHGRHFIGNGIRSLLLSDFSNNYFYLKFGFRVWKIQYQSIFAELNNGSSKSLPGDTLLPKKYKATHYLSFKPSPKFEIGFFETVVFSREDHFEFQYLNPVILYRTVEFLLDSPDNVIIGLNLNWHALPKTSFYGQLILDELRTNELFAGKGWWGNKLGYQIGAKHFDIFGIKNLDIQVELNRVRPYTYSHNRVSDAFPELSVSSYSHNNQALAHPLGANFTEAIVVLRYQPIQKIIFNLRYLHTVVGRDIVNNLGSDILLNNATRASNYNNELHQGAKSQINNFDLSASYELFYNMFLDGFVKIRFDENERLKDIDNVFFGTGVRYNIGNRKIDY